MARSYYMLVASLPRLVHFERAERMPINRQRLEQRLRNLDPSHAGQLSEASRLVEWRQQPAGRTDTEAVELYRRVTSRLTHPVLRAFVEFRMDQRTVMAGLRRRQAGDPAPPAGETWGIPPRADWVRRHWEAPDFNLGGHYPWINEARRLLEARSALELERLLMNVVWQRLGRVADTRPFGFESVFAFSFKWDILNRWLSYQAEAAVERFRELVTEGMREYQKQYG